MEVDTGRAIAISTKVRTMDDRFVKRARAVDLFKNDRGDHLIVEKGGLAIGDLVLERDPQPSRDFLRRRHLTPMREHRFLDPRQIVGIVDVPHEVDFTGRYGDAVVMACGHEFTLV